MDPLVMVAMFIGFVSLSLIFLNVALGQKSTGEPSPMGVRWTWYISVASILIPYLVLIALVMLGYFRFRGDLEDPSPFDRKLIKLTLVNCGWSLMLVAAVLIGVFFFL